MPGAFVRRVLASTMSRKAVLTPPRRVLLVSAVLGLICGGLIWNLVFDLWLGQVERQYLLEQTRAELGVAPRVSLKAVMARAVHEGACIASGWTLLVLVSIGGAAAYAFQQGRQDGQARQDRHDSQAEDDR